MLILGLRFRSFLFRLQTLNLKVFLMKFSIEIPSKECNRQSSKCFIWRKQNLERKFVCSSEREKNNDVKDDKMKVGIRSKENPVNKFYSENTNNPKLKSNFETFFFILS